MQKNGNNIFLFSQAIYIFFLNVMQAQISCPEPHTYNIHHSLKIKVFG
jgi:hypothetical protein